MTCQLLANYNTFYILTNVKVIQNQKSLLNIEIRCTFDFIKFFEICEHNTKVRTRSERIEQNFTAKNKLQ